jgi:WhiB family redox-sensing transcriptional regulator
MTTLADIPGPWRLDAACNPLTADTYYPHKGSSSAAAKEVCHHCYVEGECLAYALERNEKVGIWGGKSRQERRAMRAKAAEAVTP